MSQSSNKAEFWIVNVSKKNVTLGDLALSVPAGRNMNLLDSKHFTYTLEQLQKSAESGSLFVKREMIKIRNVPPKVEIRPGLYVMNESRGTKPRSLVAIEEKHYEELQVSDEKYAEEAAELVEEPKK